MPYFSDSLVREGRLLNEAVILTGTGESQHASEVTALPPASWRENHLVRTLARNLVEAYGDNLEEIQALSEEFDQQTIQVDKALLCPITKNLFENPVVADDGQTYERDAILEWITYCEERHQTPSSPITRARISRDGLVPNRLIHAVITHALASRSEALQGEPPVPIVRGVGGRLPRDIIREFCARVRNHWLPVGRLVAQASSGSAAAPIISSQHGSGEGSLVFASALAAGSRAVPAAIAASAETSRDLVSSTSDIVSSIFGSGGGGGARRHQSEDAALTGGGSSAGGGGAGQGSDANTGATL